MIGAGWRIAEWHGQQRIATGGQRAEAEGPRRLEPAVSGPIGGCPQQRLGGRRIQRSAVCWTLAGFGAGVGGRTAPQRAHELVMKTRDLSTGALKKSGMYPNIAATTADTRSTAGPPAQPWLALPPRRPHSVPSQRHQNSPAARRYRDQRHGETV